MEFVAATGNAGKLRELRRILERMGHTVVSQKEAGILLEPEETGETFAENAAIKARAVCEACGKPTIADDSGLCVDALHGAPGVHSARYCGRHGDDEANNDKLLKEMAGYPDKKDRTAAFVSVICVCMPDGRTLSAEGCCPGFVGYERRGVNGFGYDPLFHALAYEERSYAELADNEKDAVSHRGAALRELEKQLPGFLAGTTKKEPLC